MIKVADFLSDSIRHFSYNWIMENLEGIKRVTLLDIGTRESGFAAFLSSVGYKVTSVERDKQFIKNQESFKKRFNTDYKMIQGDLLDIPNTEKYNIITSIYALQHNIEKDIECYEKCAVLCDRLLFIVNEFNFDEAKFDLIRNDGSLRIYSMYDVWKRIINPISRIKTIKSLSFVFTKFIFSPNQSISFVPQKEANTVMIKICLN